MTQTPPYQVTDPATGEVTETFPFATDAEARERSEEKVRGLTPA